MYGGEKGLQEFAVKHGAQKFELLVGVAQTIAVGKVELFAVYFRGERFAVHDDAALAGQIVAAPKVMVSREKVDFYSQVGQFGQLAQKAGVSFGHYGTEFVPEVEHVSQQVYGRCLVLDAVLGFVRVRWLVSPGEHPRGNIHSSFSTFHFQL